jgi:hypothetical protein
MIDAQDIKMDQTVAMYIRMLKSLEASRKDKAKFFQDRHIEITETLNAAILKLLPEYTVLTGKLVDLDFDRVYAQGDYSIKMDYSVKLTRIFYDDRKDAVFAGINYSNGRGLFGHCNVPLDAVLPMQEKYQFVEWIKKLKR